MRVGGGNYRKGQLDKVVRVGNGMWEGARRLKRVAVLLIFILK